MNFPGQFGIILDMNKLYRFSPIISDEDLQKVWNYLTVELQKLSEKVLGEVLPVSILKVFPHYLDEYDYLYKTISEKGPKSSFASDKNLYVDVSEMIEGNKITAIGVRIVDPYRMQVGCGDYEVDNFSEYREKHIKSPYVRDAKDSVEMLEIWHPDFDVLGYVIPR